jgi:hypothetical protein
VDAVTGAAADQPVVSRPAPFDTCSTAQAAPVKAIIASAPKERPTSPSLYETVAARSTMNDVWTAEGDDVVVTTPPADRVCVMSSAPAYVVISGASRDRVTPGTARYVVVTASAAEGVIARTTV